MNLARIAICDLAYYGPWWIAFVVIAFFVPRYVGWLGASSLSKRLRA